MLGCSSSQVQTLAIWFLILILKFVSINYECVWYIIKYVELNFIGILVNIVIHNKQYSSFYLLRWARWRIRFSLRKFTLFYFLKVIIIFIFYLNISNSFVLKKSCMKYLISIIGFQSTYWVKDKFWLLRFIILLASFGFFRNKFIFIIIKILWAFCHYFPISQ